MHSLRTYEKRSTDWWYNRQMLKKRKKIVAQSLFWFLVFLLILLVSTRIYVVLVTQSMIKLPEDTPSSPAAIVFGAGLRRDGTPTLILQDRIETAVQLYRSGQVKKILMSGDNRFIEYNEPGSMREYALGLGVPAEDIVLDYAGRSTYDTCYRAKAIFQLENAILITQSFHLPRALYTCQILGLKVTGVAANNKTFHRSSILYWNLREIPATLNALWELHISHPLPVLGDEEPIFPPE
jgi:SanA protein